MSAEIINIQYDIFGDFTRADFSNPYDGPTIVLEKRGLRFFWSVIADLCAGALGGAIGGPGGAVAGAVLGSGFTLAEIIKVENGEYGSIDDLISNDEYTAYWTDMSEDKIQGKDIGYWHNRILTEVFEELGDRIYTISDTELKNILIKKTNTLLNINCNALLNTSHINNIIQSSKKSLEYSSAENIVNHYSQAYPTIKQEITVVGTYLGGLASVNNVKEMDNYFKRTEEAVVQSNLSSSQKTVIQSGISVAGASYSLWK